MRPEHDPSWSQYPNTIVEVGDDPTLAFSVTNGPTAQQRLRLAKLGLPDTWAIVTPCNPRGREVSNDDNKARLANAKEDLESRGVRHWSGHGRSTDGTHIEQGFAIAVDRESARQLAIAWEQSAFFWIEDEDVWLCPALVRGADERITSTSTLVRICPLTSIRATDLGIPEWEWGDDLFQTIPRLSDRAGTKLSFGDRSRTLVDLVAQMKRWKALPPLNASIELSVPRGEEIPAPYAHAPLWGPTVPDLDAHLRDEPRAAIVAVLALACSDPPSLSWENSPNPERLVNAGTLFVRLHTDRAVRET